MVEAWRAGAAMMTASAAAFGWVGSLTGSYAAIGWGMVFAWTSVGVAKYNA